MWRWACLALALARPHHLTVRVDPFSKPLYLRNGTATNVVVTPDAASFQLWVCLTDTEPPSECQGSDDSPPQPRDPVNEPPCRYITRACECVQWQPTLLTTTRSGWTLTDADRQCARLVYVHNNTLGGVQPHPMFSALTLTWQLEAVAWVPSRTAIVEGAQRLGLATTLTEACQIAASLERSDTGRRTGCRRTLALGVYTYVRRI